MQRDHADLIRMTARRLLAPQGILLFATNRRGFTLAREELPGLRREGPVAGDPRARLRARANRHHVSSCGPRTDDPTLPAAGLRV